jgi:NAD(P)H-hydrate epimerase
MEPFTLTREQVRELDRRAIEGFGVPGIVLMENAGRGCAELLMRLNPNRKPTVILCGPGNNGGDGFVIARHLDNHGITVWVFAFCDPESLTGDAAIQYRPVCLAGLQWCHPFASREDLNQLRIAHLEGVLQETEQAWVVDALFGTGLSRLLATPFAEVVAAVNASHRPVLAVDIPSGLDCDTGEPLGPTVRATHTATFVAPKRGFLNPKSREWTGEVHVIDIGAPRVLVEEYRNRPTA